MSKKIPSLTQTLKDEHIKSFHMFVQGEKQTCLKMTSSSLMVTFLLLRVKSCQINIHKKLANIAIQLNLILLKPSIILTPNIRTVKSC